MKLKTTIGASVLTMSLLGASSFAADYPVQPVDNWIAKKALNYIFTDEWLAKNTTEDARIEAANSTNAMSELIVKSIKDTGIADDGFLSDNEMKELNTYMFQKYHNKIIKLHWDDEKEKINWKKVKVETWFHRVVNNGGTTKWYIHLKKHYKKANRIADGVFHLGLNKTMNDKKILNEDGNKNVRWRLISRALYEMLKDDLHLKSWSKKSYYKPQIQSLKKERNTKVAEMKKTGATKAEIRAVKNKYNAKIRELRKAMRS